jgi:hypothetical protein
VHRYFRSILVYCKYPYAVGDLARDLGAGFSTEELSTIQEVVNVARATADDEHEYEHGMEDVEDVED